MATKDDDDATGDGASDETDREELSRADSDGRYPFAGLTRYDNDVDALTLPENVTRDTSSMYHWAVNQADWSDGYQGGVERDIETDMLPERGLHTLINELPRAQHAQAAWIHPRTGEVMATGKHNAVIEPMRAEDASDGYSRYADAIADITDRELDSVQDDIEAMSAEEYIDDYLTPEQRSAVRECDIGDDALFQIAGGNHTVINPQQPLGVLTDLLQERGLGEHVFGEVEIDRGGGRATLDIYMDGKHVESPTFAEGREPVVVGLQVQWSFFSDWAFRVCGQALDWACANNIHRLTDREVVKYAGDIESRVEWEELFESVLDRLNEKRDHLSTLIEAASEETLAFSDLPDGIGSELEGVSGGPWSALYYHLGLPAYLSEYAGTRLRSRADDAYEPTWWDIHSAATYAVTHYDRSSRTSGGAYETHARIANDMLVNPASMEEAFVDSYEAEQASRESETLAEHGGGRVDIHTAFDNLRDKREQYEEWEEDLVEMGIQT